jgi:hypothetical protein
MNCIKIMLKRVESGNNQEIILKFCYMDTISIYIFAGVIVGEMLLGLWVECKAKKKKN